MISALLIVCDEEKRLPGAIASVRGIVDEVVVVVQESQDNTVAVAAMLAHKVVLDKCWLLSEPSRELGVANCSHEWILGLDADEVLTPHGASLLQKVCAEAKCDGFELPHTTIIGDCLIERIPRMRLFRKSQVLCPKEVHSTYQLRSGQPLCIEGPDWIDHRKTWDEQNLDNARYARIATNGY